MRSRFNAVAAALAVFAVVLPQISLADLSDGLVARYTFDGNANDSSDNGLHGTVYGATLSRDRFGNLDCAYHFDGIDDYIRVADDPRLDGMSALTLSVWIQIDDRDREAEVLNKYVHYTGSRFDDSYIIGIDNGGQIAFQYATASDYAIEITSATLGVDSWHHIAGVYTGAEGRVYIDGVLAALWRDDPNPGGALNSIADDLLIGCANTNTGLAKFFSGRIDDVRIYDRALSDIEVHDLSVVPLPGAVLLAGIGLCAASYRLRRRTS